jgi:hypothetical protein
MSARSKRRKPIWHKPRAVTLHSTKPLEARGNSPVSRLEAGGNSQTAERLGQSSDGEQPNVGPIVRRGTAKRWDNRPTGNSQTLGQSSDGEQPNVGTIARRENSQALGQSHDGRTAKRWDNRTTGEQPNVGTIARRANSQTLGQSHDESC